jgi:uncharacterized protein (DUF849 family)
MNVTECMTPDDIAGTSLENPRMFEAYREMVIDATPAFFVEHLKRLRAHEIQPHFMLANLPQLETVERLIRAGAYMGPLVHNLVQIGGGADGPNPYNLMEYVRRAPHGSVMFVESVMRSVIPLCTMGIALGLHVRVGIEDNIWRRKGERMTSVQQIEQMVRIARELGREVASGDDARHILKIAAWYNSVDETLHHLGLPPQRPSGQRGFLTYDITGKRPDLDELDQRVPADVRAPFVL